MPKSNTVKIDPKISIGFGTAAGMLAALAQYAGALALMLAGDLTTESIGTMATATATLVTVLIGRYKQASDAIKSASAERATNPLRSVEPLKAGEAVGVETNVLYLDGQQIANAVVKSINTNAMLQSLQTQTERATPTEPAPTSGPTEI